MNVRKQAFQILKQICLQKAYGNLLLKQVLIDIPQKDKNLITQIVYGTLKTQQMCRYQWISHIEKTPPDPIAILLDMSLYQILYLDRVPDYAIINEAVDIAKKQIHSHATLVNAVLRKVITTPVREVNGTEFEKLAIETSHPVWLIKMWYAQYGKAIARKICESNMEIKPNTIRCNTMKQPPTTLKKDKKAYQSGKLSKNALYYLAQSPQLSALYKEGNISIQDEASQKVVEVFNPQPNESILDLCSAPGTKCCYMAECMRDQGNIIANDIHEHRIQLIHDALKRLQLYSIETTCYDASDPNIFKGKLFDRILCDVPCSGYGVLGRKGDLKYHLHSNDMDSLIPLQQAIINNADRLLKREGILMYATCTLNKKENERQVETFLKNHPNYQIEYIRTIFPFEYHSDGFFMAKLKKL